MRYEAEQNHKSKTIVEIVDLQAKKSWEKEIVTVFNDANNRKKKSDLILNSLNLYEDLSKTTSSTTKAKLLEIIKKYL